MGVSCVVHTASWLAVLVEIGAVGIASVSARIIWSAVQFCTALLAPHIHPIVSISLEIYLGHAPRTCTLDIGPWTCTSDMHLGHAPWMPRATPRTTLGHACPTLDPAYTRESQRLLSRGHPWGSHCLVYAQRGLGFYVAVPWLGWSSCESGHSFR